MKYTLIFLFSNCIFCTSCKKDDVTSTGGNGTGRLQLLAGDNQSGLFGELLNDTIKIKFTSSNPANRFKITHIMMQGNGMLPQSFDTVYSFPLPHFADTAGVLKLRWRMGCDNNIQKIKFYIYTDTIGGAFYSSPSDSIVVTASATKPTGWCRACGYGNVDQFYSKIATADNNTLYLANFGLYSSVDGGLNWYKVNGIPYGDEIMDVQFNSQQWMYVLTKNHGIYYSQNMQQWTAINNGILDMRDPTAFFVEDTAIFVSFYFDGPYRTTDNGGFWRKLVVGGGSQRFYHFARHPSGKLMLFDDWTDLKVSDDNGDTWAVANLSHIYRNYSVYDFKIDANGMLYIGAGDATISVVDPVNYQGTVHSYYEWNASSQLINNITLTPNDVYYLVNYTPAPGIYSKSNNWGPVNIGFANPINYYFLKNNGGFLLFSKNWIYYNH